MNRRVLGLVFYGPLMLLIVVPLMFVGTACRTTPVQVEVLDGITGEAAEAEDTFDFSVTVRTEAQRYNTAAIESFTDGPQEMRVPGLAAKWVEGVRIELSEDEISKFEEGLYSTRTKEEYEKYLEESNLAHYDKGIDLSVFEWYWDEFYAKCSDRRVDVIRRSPAEDRIVPNVVGLHYEEAKRVLDEEGFTNISIVFVKELESNPPGFCFGQSEEAGSLAFNNRPFEIRVQRLLPARVASVPDLIGRTAPEIAALLDGLGLQVVYSYHDNPHPGYDTMYCFDQKLIHGSDYDGDTLEIHMRYLPDLIGLSDTEVRTLMEVTGMRLEFNYLDEPAAGYETAHCFYASVCNNSTGSDEYMYAYFSYVPYVSPEQ